MHGDEPVTVLKGVGDSVAKALKRLGITSVHELLMYYPRRYNDYSTVSTIQQLKPGTVTIEAKIMDAKGRYVTGGLHVTEAVASDKTGSVRLVWFNQPYRAASLKKGMYYYLTGEFGLKRGRLSIQNPSIELVSDFPLSTARIVPVYRETKGLTSKQLRRYIAEALQHPLARRETLPISLLTENHLLPRYEAVKLMHFPDSARGLALAKRRLGFEEIFELSLASYMNRLELSREHALNVPFKESLAKKFVNHLPYKLTDAQRKVIWQIYIDMERGQPMNRLVEGDVGSGKTVVAAMAAMMVMAHDMQVAFMAPTELLAKQHAESLYELFEPLGYGGAMSLLVGSMTSAQKAKAYEAIAEGRAKCLVGTHALIQEKVNMQRLGLVIVDEQHRFGVEQRKSLQAKAGHMPHVLSMTATPIPRSLALTLYGEMDISIIDALPSGRLDKITRIFPSDGRIQLNRLVKKEIDSGRQCFWVCPLITAQNEEGSHIQRADISAEGVYKRLRDRDFKEYRIALLHGKMKANEKDEVMAQFLRHDIDIVVSTTVIEVGVNVPNATVMVIEAAERFGLAQIHQLRGRVGRGEHRGYCFLLMSENGEPSRRLRMLEQSNDGFRLAEFDLEERGPGAIYGTMQHGALDLRVAKLSDTKLIAAARQAARKFHDSSKRLVEYPYLAHKVTVLRSITSIN